MQTHFVRELGKLEGSLATNQETSRQLAAACCKEIQNVYNLDRSLPGAELFQYVKPKAEALDAIREANRPLEREIEACTVVISGPLDQATL